MPTELGRAFSPSFAGYPPHMSAEDYEIWTQLRPELTRGAAAIYFDVALGAGRAAPADTPENLSRMWLRINQKRADVILDQVQHWTILELRHNALSNAIGRLLMYQQLWNEAPPDPRPLELWLATNTEDADLARLAHAQGIRYITTGAG